MSMKVVVLVAAATLAVGARADAELRLQGLQVEYRHTPIGIDETQPRFGWHMVATAGERGIAQAARRIEVDLAFLGE